MRPLSNAVKNSPGMRRVNPKIYPPQKNNHFPLILSALTLLFSLYFGPRKNPSFLLPYLSIPAAAFILFLGFLEQKNKKEYRLNAKTEDLQGKINILYDQLKIEESKNKALHLKLKKYDNLALLTERLNQNLSLDDALKLLTKECFQLLGQQKSTCLIYLSDSYSELSLAGSYGPEADNSVIKEKKGDIFSQWALKHTQPLLVEDTASDFRFDGQILKKTSQRVIGSLISSCLISQNRPLGILRLDSPEKKLFNLEDLRLLNTIADIASVAIDNAGYYQNIKELAIKDSLTGLYTHKHTMERLEEELRRCLVNENSLAVLMLDIDFFKKYNDQYGHLAGDIVLKNLSFWLKDSIKGRDAIIGRLGGEEFLVILPLASKQEAFSLAENTRSFIQAKTINLRRKKTGITVSIGVAGFPQDAGSTSDLIDKADTALYEAKRLGRNRVCLF